MKHGKKGRKLSRRPNQRRTLLKILAVDLILKEKITTTESKAKELRSFVERLITKSKSARGGNNLATVRYLVKYLPVKVCRKMIEEIGPRFQKRAGGYTRIIKLGLRKTDGAKMAIIELVEQGKSLAGKASKK